MRRREFITLLTRAKQLDARAADRTPHGVPIELRQEDFE
jgi:hypothetical protein